MVDPVHNEPTDGFVGKAVANLEKAESHIELDV